MILKPNFMTLKHRLSLKGFPKISYFGMNYYFKDTIIDTIILQKYKSTISEILKILLTSKRKPNFTINVYAWKQID